MPAMSSGSISNIVLSALPAPRGSDGVARRTRPDYRAAGPSGDEWRARLLQRSHGECRLADFMAIGMLIIAGSRMATGSFALGVTGMAVWIFGSALAIARERFAQAPAGGAWP